MTSLEPATTLTPTAAVDAFVTNRLTANPTAPDLSAGKLASLEHAYEMQFLLRDRHVQLGNQQIGHKLGIVNQAGRERFGLDAPVTGFLVEGSVLDTGSTFELKPETEPPLGIEAEIAFYFRREVGAGATANEVVDAISHAAPAFELVRTSPPGDKFTLVGGNVSHEKVVFGPKVGVNPAILRFWDTTNFEIANGDPFQNGTASADIIDSPFATIAELAKRLAERGEAIKPDQMVICGSFMGIQPVNAGDQWSLKLPGMYKDATVEIGFVQGDAD